MEVPKVAAKYQLTLNPTVLPTFPDDDNVYYGENPLPPTPPSFPVWPDPSTLIARPDTYGLAGADGAVPTAGMDLFESLQENLDRFLRTQAKESHLGSTMFGNSDAFVRELKSQTTDWSISESGIEVKGAQITALWAEPSVTVTQVAERWMVRKSGVSLQRPVPILLELDEGGREALFVSMTALPQFGAFLICNEQGASALRYESWEKDTIAPEVTEKALEAMESGTLRSDQAKMLALSIRRAKHAAPVLGAIAAYLYDSAGDLESIQRMAQFYIDMMQPIPYDVALMGQLDGEWRGPQLWAKVPPIGARTQPEPGAPWDSHAIAGGWGVVGGMWPWMRQGWAFLDAPEDIGSQLIRSVLLDVREHLTSARFTTGDKAGAMLLAQAFGLQRKERQATQILYARA